MLQPLFEDGYSTVKSVRISSWKLGLLYYSIMFVVVTYVLAFSLWWERGYQVLSSMSGVVVCKIKGSATATGKDVPLIYQGKVWDAAELVEYNTNGFFIPLSILVTNQKQGYCTAGNHSGDLGGSGNLESAESCNPQRPCEAGRLTFSGMHTGACIADGSKPLASGEKPGLIGVCDGGEFDGEPCFGGDDKVTCGNKGDCIGSFCEIKGFCPIELSTPSASQLLTFSGIGDMSVFARVDSIFEKFGERHSNVAPGSAGVCTLNASEASLGCGAPNQFNVDEMLRRAGVELDASTLATGVEILVSVTWADANPMFATKGHYPCDLDFSDWREKCRPTFTMTQIDDPNPRAFSHGYNFRSSRTFTVPDSKGGTEEQRELRKQIGIKVIFVQEGQGGKFDAATAGQAFGSGLALLSLATLAAEVVLLYLSPKRSLYRQAKYEVCDSYVSHSHDHGHVRARSSTVELEGAVGLLERRASDSLSDGEY